MREGGATPCHHADGLARLPAAELAACCPGRWAATEIVIGEDKSAITDAGPPHGPLLRSSSPHQVTQEMMWARITASQLVRIQGC